MSRSAWQAAADELAEAHSRGAIDDEDWFAEWPGSSRLRISTATTRVHSQTVRAFPSGVGDLDVVVHDDPELKDRDEDQREHRQADDELDERLATLVA